MYPQNGNNRNVPLDRWNNIQMQHQTLFSNTTTIGFTGPATDTNRQDNRQFLMPHPTNASLVNNMLNHINGMNSTPSCSLFNNDNDIFPMFNTPSENRNYRDNSTHGQNVQLPISVPQGPKPDAGDRSYAKRLKSSNPNPGEFRMRNKDFPALPGTANSSTASSSRANPAQQWSTKTFGLENKSANENCAEPFMSPMFNQPGASRPIMDFPFMTRHTDDSSGIQISPEGKVTNIPGSMLKDQFGIIGQIMTLRAASSDPSLVELSIGLDLTALGMDMNSPGNNYPLFGGPFKHFRLQPHEIEHQVPSEYIIHDKIKDKLAPINLCNFGEELLFYLFYNYCGDVLQKSVAQELYLRNWRYHIEHRKWITRLSEINVSETDGIIFECGVYNVFDTENWCKVPRKLYVDHSKLENPTDDA